MTTKAVASIDAPVAYIAHTCTMPGHWAKADSIDEAAKRLRQIAGSKFFRDNGYKVFRCHPDTSVGDLGGFRYPIDGGYEPVEILDRSKHTKASK